MMKFNFSRALKRAQEIKGVRSIDLARHLGVHRQQVTRWRSQSDARVSLCCKICNALELELLDFMEMGK